MPDPKDSQPVATAGTRKRILIATYEVDLRALAAALLDSYEPRRARGTSPGDVEH